MYLAIDSAAAERRKWRREALPKVQSWRAGRWSNLAEDECGEKAKETRESKASSLAKGGNEKGGPMSHFTLVS